LREDNRVKGRQSLRREFHVARVLDYFFTHYLSTNISIQSYQLVHIVVAS